MLLVTSVPIEIQGPLYLTQCSTFYSTLAYRKGSVEKRKRMAGRPGRPSEGKAPMPRSLLAGSDPLQIDYSASSPHREVGQKRLCIYTLYSTRRRSCKVRIVSFAILLSTSCADSLRKTALPADESLLSHQATLLTPAPTHAALPRQFSTPTPFSQLMKGQYGVQ